MPLSEEQLYDFDVMGWLVEKGAFSTAQVERVTSAISASPSGADDDHTASPGVTGPPCQRALEELAESTALLPYLDRIIPGSQRSSLFLPDTTRTGQHLGPVCRVPMKAGDVLLFLGNAVTHGASPWVSERPRRVAMLDYLSSYSALARL